MQILEDSMNLHFVTIFSPFDIRRVTSFFIVTLRDSSVRCLFSLQRNLTLLSWFPSLIPLFVVVLRSASCLVNYSAMTVNFRRSSAPFVVLRFYSSRFVSIPLYPLFPRSPSMPFVFLFVSIYPCLSSFPCPTFVKKELSK